jgi:hypothetical protein
MNGFDFFEVKITQLYGLDLSFIAVGDIEGIPFKKVTF